MTISFRRPGNYPVLILLLFLLLMRCSSEDRSDELGQAPQEANFAFMDLLEEHQGRDSALLKRSLKRNGDARKHIHGNRLRPKIPLDYRPDTTTKLNNVRNWPRTRRIDGLKCKIRYEIVNRGHHREVSRSWELFMKRGNGWGA